MNIEKFVKDNYPYRPVNEVANELGISKQALYQLASNLGVEKAGKRKGDVSILLNESLVTYYWLGFLLADGNFYKRKLVRLKLAKKDEDHLMKFASYIKFSGKIQRRSRVCEISKYKTICHSVGVSLQHKKVVEEICDKFDISSRKTYSPPSVDVFKRMTDDQFTAMLVGFIDGDGTIINNKPREKIYCAMTISVHKNWLPQLKYWGTRIKKIFHFQRNFKSFEVVKHTHTMCRMGISDNYVLALMKKFAQDNSLPIMARKWDRVDIDFYGVNQSAVDIDKALLDLDDKESSCYTLADKIGVGWYDVRNSRQRLKKYRGINYISRRYDYGRAHVLLDGSILSAFTIGQLCSRTMPSNKIEITTNDLCTLDRISDYIGITVVKSSKGGTISIKNKNLIDKIKIKIDSFSNSEFKAFFCGMIDCKGCFTPKRGSAFISKEMASFNKQFFDRVVKEASKSFGKIAVGFPQIILISAKPTTRAIKLFVEKHKLCVGKKWDKISIKLSKKEIAEQRDSIIHPLLETGTSQGKICSITGFKLSTVKESRKRFKKLQVC